MSLLESRRFALNAAISLCTDVPINNSAVRRRPLLNELALFPVKEPLNREEDLFTKFLLILEKRNITNILKDKNPYWLKDTHYNLMEVVGTSIQFIDQHNSSLPKTTLPPAHDIETFINSVLQESKPVTIDRQFDILLDITNNNVIGAANVGMLATRYMARFADQRAYPNLIIGDKKFTIKTDDKDITEIMRLWNTKIARFKLYDNSDKNDAIGDIYYFWTHLFAACVLSTDGFEAKAFQKVFERGTDLMIFVKDYIARARNGVVTSHFESSLLGRTIGLSLAYL